MVNAGVGAPRAEGDSGNRAAIQETLPQQVLDAVSDPIFVLEGTDLVRASNRAARTLLGIENRDGEGVDIAGLGLRGRLSDGDLMPLSGDLWIQSAAGQSLQLDHDARWFRAAITPLDGGRRVVHLRDVTTENREREVQQDMRREFLSAAAHKFTTPLTAIKMYVHLLRTYIQRSDEQSPLLNHVRMLDHHLNRLGLEVNEVMDLAQLRSGRLSLHIQPIDVVGLARRVVDGFKLNRSEREVRLEPQTPYVVASADEPRFEQVLRLVLDNADRYSMGQTPVVLRISGDDREARVEVEDQGVGIPEIEQAMLFTPYFRAENVQSLRLGSGLGLGLYLSREIVRQHGGEIQVQSVQDQGTRVIITLPKNRPKPRDAATPG